MTLKVVSGSRDILLAGLNFHFLSYSVTSCENVKAGKGIEEESDPLKDLAQFVDPMIGTAKMEHTCPGATVPLGSVQLNILSPMPLTEVTTPMFTNTVRDINMTMKPL